ncbi:MAG: hypothetical protein Q9181_000718 [Wetmoreana brouardii]
MFSRRTHSESLSKHHNSSFDKHRAGKATSSKQKRSFRDRGAAVKKIDVPKKPDHSPPSGSTLTSAIVTICVGSEQRLFAAHEDVLSHSSFFAAICRGQFLESSTKRVNLPEELPEIFSCVLEYLYKGDYYPRLLHNKRRNSWELEDTENNRGSTAESTVFHPNSGQALLKDTMLYCTADRYGLEELKRLALRKQGLQSGIQCSTILASARFFDLFVAICNHMDDMAPASKSPFTKSPRTPH